MADTPPRKRQREAPGAFKAPTIREVADAAPPGTTGAAMYASLLDGRVEEDLLAIDNKRLVVGSMVKVTGTGSLWRCAEGTLSTGRILAVNATRETLAGKEWTDDLKSGYVNVQFTRMKQHNKKFEQFKIAFRASMVSVLTGLELTRAEHQFETGVNLCDIDELEIKKQIHKDLLAAEKRKLVVGAMVMFDITPFGWKMYGDNLGTGRIVEINTTREAASGLKPGRVSVQFTKLRELVAEQQNASLETFEYIFRASNLYVVPEDELARAEHQFESGAYPETGEV